MTAVPDDDAAAAFGHFVDERFHQIQVQLRPPAEQTIQQSGRLFIQKDQLFGPDSHLNRFALQALVVKYFKIQSSGRLLCDGNPT